MTIRIRPALPADAHRLSHLAAQTFRETFAGDNSPDDMARYLAESFTVDRQAREIADPAGIVLLAEIHGAENEGDLVGYAHLLSGTAPDAVHGSSPLELKRLYVSRAWLGRGVSQSLMDAALDTARAKEADVLWLGVWERNTRAVSFYTRYGFTRVGEHTFMLGADAQTDWLLARPVEGASLRCDVFFYGLFMDVAMLEAKCVSVASSQQAVVQGWALRIGERATLVPRPGSRVHGMLMSLSLPDIDRLYADASVRMYRPVAVLAEVGEAKLPALAYVLAREPASEERNAEYADRLRSLAERIGLPADYSRSIG